MNSFEAMIFYGSINRKRWCLNFPCSRQPTFSKSPSLKSLAKLVPLLQREDAASLNGRMFSTANRDTIIKHPDMHALEKVCYVNGHRLCELLCKADLGEAELAEKLAFSEQTIRNYLTSTPDLPWKASLKKVHQLATEFKVDVRELTLDIATPPADSLSRAIEAADHRFMGDPEKCRSIAGIWDCESADIPIPGQLDYTHTIPWSARAEIIQTGSFFLAKGIDKDEDVVLARGTLLETGNIVRFAYWIEHPRKREYGSGLLVLNGAGNLMEGFFLGRDAGQSSKGLLLAKIVFKLVDNP